MAQFLPTAEAVGSLAPRIMAAKDYIHENIRALNERIPILSFRPKFRQFLASNFYVIVLALITLRATYMRVFILADLDFSCLVRFVCWVVLAVMACRLINLMAISYEINSERIIVRCGIFVRTTFYTELYRIVDYQESTTFFQRFWNVKTVLIISGDKLNPIIQIPGVPINSDLVSLIRQRVEWQKYVKKVREFSNR